MKPSSRIRKFLSLVLSAGLIATSAVPSFAAEYVTETPEENQAQSQEVIVEDMDSKDGEVLGEGLAEEIIGRIEESGDATVSADVTVPLDVSLVIDSTGSMWDTIESVKNNIEDFITQLDEAVITYEDGTPAYKLDSRVSIIEFRDSTWDDSRIYRDVKAYTFDDSATDGSQYWSKDPVALKNAVSKIRAYDGGDYYETPTVAMEMLTKDGEVKWRDGAQKVVVLFTDAPYKNSGEVRTGTAYAGMGKSEIPAMEGIIEDFKDQSIQTFFMTSVKYFYEPLAKYNPINEIHNLTEGLEVVLKAIIESKKLSFSVDIGNGGSAKISWHDYTSKDLEDSLVNATFEGGMGKSSQEVRPETDITVEVTAASDNQVDKVLWDGEEKKLDADNKVTLPVGTSDHSLEITFKVEEKFNVTVSENDEEMGVVVIDSSYGTENPYKVSQSSGIFSLEATPVAGWVIDSFTVEDMNGVRDEAGLVGADTKTKTLNLDIISDTAITVNYVQAPTTLVSRYSEHGTILLRRYLKKGSGRDSYIYDPDYPTPENKDDVFYFVPDESQHMFDIHPDNGYEVEHVYINGEVVTDLENRNQALVNIEGGDVEVEDAGYAYLVVDTLKDLPSDGSRQIVISASFKKKENPLPKVTVNAKGFGKVIVDEVLEEGGSEVAEYYGDTWYSLDEAARTVRGERKLQIGSTHRVVDKSDVVLRLIPDDPKELDTIAVVDGDADVPSANLVPNADNTEYTYTIKDVDATKRIDVYFDDDVIHYEIAAEVDNYGVVGHEYVDEEYKITPDYGTEVLVDVAQGDSITFTASPNHIEGPEGEMYMIVGIKLDGASVPLTDPRVKVISNNGITPNDYQFTLENVTAEHTVLFQVAEFLAGEGTDSRQIGINYTQSVSYDGRKHIRSTETSSKKNAADVEITLWEFDGSGQPVDRTDVLNNAKIKFKNNKVVATTDAKKASFTVKLKKNAMPNLSRRTLAQLKKKAYTFTVEPADLSLVGEGKSATITATKTAERIKKLVYGVTGKDGQALQVNMKYSSKPDKSDYTYTRQNDGSFLITGGRNFTGSTIVK